MVDAQHAALELARSDEATPVQEHHLDSDPWLLAVRNGTIDLRTGLLREHRRSDLITHLCDVDYEPAAVAPRWTQFLQKVVPGSELCRFVKKAIGYSLTGDVSEQVFFLCYGTGANGKSVFLETIISLLDGLAVKCPSDTIAKTRGTGIPNDVARLVGKRFAVVVELEDDFRISEARVKELVGGDRMTARFMRGEWFDFSPACKLWLASNYKPRIKGVDHGMWRRVRLIPFEVKIENPDRTLVKTLRRELPGILRWAVEGCVEWKAEGLAPPERVRIETSRYKAAEDLVGRFIDDECEVGQGLSVTKGQLNDAFKRWCNASGEDVPSGRTLNARLGDLGVRPTRTSSARSWLGIGLRANT